MDQPTITWSCGGGLQSAAIAVLIREGAVPRPALSGIADTSREVSTTWAYVKDVLNPYLSPVGVEIEVVPRELATKDLYGPDGLTLMPAWTAEGRKASFCSGHWKRDVMERWLRLKGVKKCVQYIGFSLDEISRCGPAHRNWCQPIYPLIDKGLSKGACRRIVEAAGLPVPNKSRCWQCPHQTAEEWKQVRDNSVEFEAAVQVDYEIRENDPEQKGDLFLHYSRKPLDMVDFDAEIAKDDLPLFRPCQDAGCFT